MANASKADILTFAGRAWQTTFTGNALDEAIKACLGDLNTSDLLSNYEGIGWRGEEYVGPGKNIVEIPNYKSMISFMITNYHPGVVDGNPRGIAMLQELPGGLDTWESLTVQSTKKARPQWWVEWPPTWRVRVYPIPDQHYGVLILCWMFHPLTPDAILYEAKFQHLLNLGTVYWEAVLRRNKEYIEHWGPLYYAERQRLEEHIIPTVSLANLL